MLVILALMAIPALFAAIGMARWRYHLTRALEADRDPRLLQGEVIAPPGAPEDPVVRVDIVTRTRERINATVVEETARTREVHQFTIRTQTGDLVDVEPPPSVQLVAPLGAPAPVAKHVDHRSAQLVPGQHVWIVGAVEHARDAGGDGGPFREAEHARAVVTAADGAMVISTEPLGNALRRRAAIDRSWAITFALWTVATPAALLFLPITSIAFAFSVAFFVRSWFARTEWYERRLYERFPS